MEINFTLSEMLQRLVDDEGMLVLVVFVLLRVVLGMASAWTRKEFAVKRMGDFLAHIALPYGGSYAVFVALGDSAGELAPVGPLVLFVFQTMNLAAIAESLAEMGVQMPEVLLNLAAGRVRADEIRKRAQ